MLIILSGWDPGACAYVKPPGWASWKKRAGACCSGQLRDWGAWGSGEGDKHFSPLTSWPEFVECTYLPTFQTFLTPKYRNSFIHWGCHKLDKNSSFCLAHSFFLLRKLLWISVWVYLLRWLLGHASWSCQNKSVFSLHALLAFGNLPSQPLLEFV